MFNFLNIKKLVHNPADDILDAFYKADESTPMFTPDVSELERRFWNWVFIPDECMQLGHKHELVQKGASGFFPFYEDCYTSDKFTYLEKKLGKLSNGIPFEAINDDQLPMWMNKAYRIKGELYALSAKDMISLDNYRKNTVQFKRQRVNVNVPYSPKSVTRTQTYNGTWMVDYHSGKTHITSIEAWLYLGKMDYWRDQLEHLDNFRPVVSINDPDRIYVRRYYDYKRQREI